MKEYAIGQPALVASAITCGGGEERRVDERKMYGRERTVSASRAVRKGST